MKAPFVTVAGLLFLTGCIGTGPSAALRGDTGASLASLPAQAGAEPPLTDVISDDAAIAPARAARGTNPRAVLERTQTRLADARPSRSVVAARAQPSPLSGEAGAGGGSSRTGIGDASLPAAYLATPGTPTAATTGGTIPLLGVEAHADEAQRAQTSRDQRFDAQVRRASSLVCVGCLSETPSPSRRQVRQGRRDSDAE